MSDEEVPAEEVAEEEVEEVAEMNVLDALKEVRFMLMLITRCDVVAAAVSIRSCALMLMSFLLSYRSQ